MSICMAIARLNTDIRFIVDSDCTSGRETRIVRAMTPSSLRSMALQALPLAFVMFASACALDDQDAATTMTDDEIRVANHIRSCDRMNDEVQCHARVIVG